MLTYAATPRAMDTILDCWQEIEQPRGDGQVSDATGRGVMNALPSGIHGVFAAHYLTSPSNQLPITTESTPVAVATCGPH